MSCVTKTRQIDGKVWSCTQMSATESIEIETQLAPAFMHAVVPVMSMLTDSDESETDVISKSINAIFAAIPPADLSALIIRLCNPSLVFVDKQGVDFDRDFSGGEGIALRYKVVWFILETNYSDFFGALMPEGALEGARSKYAAKFAQKMGMSTGESGDHA